MNFRIDLDKFSRVTSSQNFIPEIDGLRFIAIITVVLFHLRTSVIRSGGFDESLLQGNFYFDVLSKGGLGVNIFFTISGFILALPFARSFLFAGRKVVLKKYYLRRLTRLEPPYIIIMSAFFLLQILFLSVDFQYLFGHFMASLFYVHFFIFGTWSDINPVAWSLETEVQFYLLAPFFAFIYKVNKIPLRFLFYFIIIASQLWFIVNYSSWLSQYHLSKSVLYYFANFFVGFMLADVFLNWSHFKDKSVSWIGDLLGIGGLIGIFYFFLKPGFIAHFMFQFSISILFYGAFKGRILNYFLTRKFITVIGGMCYTIYLLHYVFFYVAVQVLAPIIFPWIPGFIQEYIISGIILIPVLIVISTVAFYYIEKPFMYPDWTSRLKEKLKLLKQA